MGRVKNYMIKNINIDHKIISSHFETTNENMRIHKKKFEKETGGLWLVYIKAYNFDNYIIKGEKND